MPDIIDNLAQQAKDLGLDPIIELSDVLPNLPVAEALAPYPIDPQQARRVGEIAEFAIGKVATTGQLNHQKGNSLGLWGTVREATVGHTIENAQYLLMAPNAGQDAAFNANLQFGVQLAAAQGGLDQGHGAAFIAGAQAAVTDNALGNLIRDLPNSLGEKGVPNRLNGVAGPLTQREHVAAQLEGLKEQIYAANQGKKFHLKIRSPRNAQTMHNPIKPGKTTVLPTANANTNSSTGILGRPGGHRSINTTNTTVSNLRGGSQDSDFNVFDISDLNIEEHDNFLKTVFEYKKRKRILTFVIIGTLIFILFKKRKFVKKFIKKIYKILLRINKFFDKKIFKNKLTRVFFAVFRYWKLPA